MHSGACECGAVAYEITGEVRAVTQCHCGQCRKTSGHVWAATSVTDAALTITNDAGLRRYRSSDIARRGFCTGCGSSLFYRLEGDGDGKVAIGAGTLDDPTGLTTGKHIFIKNKGDYYDITCRAPQNDRS